MNRVSVIQNFIIIASRNKYFTTWNPVKRTISHKFILSLGYPFIGLLILMSSCNSGSYSGPPETPTRGNIKISVDESFKSIIDTEVYTFTHLYTNAKIKAEYKPEFDVINDFMNDSVKVIVTSKKLTDNQIQFLRDTLVVARTTTYAYDALALITNKLNTDTLLKI